jgi:hypothetical protein
MPTTSQAQLPAAWVERIWLAMRATYGAAFDRQWECPAGCDPATHVAGLKAHWAQELGVYLAKPEAIAYGLDNLPLHAPNLIEFKAACNRAPIPAARALPAPKADPDRLSATLGKLRSIGAEATGARAWAFNLRERERRTRTGLTKFQREAWREVLGDKVTEAA